MVERRLVLNATAIGHRADGIAAYAVHLVHAVWRAGLDRPLTVVLNEDARRFFPASEIPAGAAIEWVSARMSPSRGTPGNLRRWAFANRLALAHRTALVVGLSQLEAPVVGGPGIVMVHDLIPRLFPREHPRQYYFYRYYLGHALARALAIITPSQTTKDDLCRHYAIDGRRVHVIHHGCPVQVSTAPAGARADRYILWIGRADPTKNLPALLEAFALIARQVSVRLVIAGEDASIDLAAPGMDRAMLDRVTVVGPISEAMKLALLDGASALVCPSLYEGFGFPPLEAMARGCPVVTALTGATPEVCGDAALYVDARQPSQIAAALLRIVADSELASTLAARGRERSRGFTWDASVRAHLALFDQAARVVPAGRPGPAGARESRLEGDVVE
jgi:glycosyltransferase involved in cell wall biosynthesis